MIHVNLAAEMPKLKVRKEGTNKEKPPENVQIRGEKKAEFKTRETEPVPSS